MIALVDYGFGNPASVAHAFEAIGHPVMVVREPHQILEADAIVLPGVGHFGAAMDRLRAHFLDVVLTRSVLGRGVPFLGICLGMQLLADGSDEAPGVPGLRWLPGGQVRRIEADRVPHVGWNDVIVSQGRRPHHIYAGLGLPATFYFLHSYHLCFPGPPALPVREALTSQPMVTASVEANHIWGVQYHPEKSQQAGLQVLRNFVRAAGLTGR